MYSFLNLLIYTPDALNARSLLLFLLAQFHDTEVMLAVRAFDDFDFVIRLTGRSTRSGFFGFRLADTKFFLIETPGYEVTRVKLIREHVEVKGSGHVFV
jgi:hypothetical protein